MMTSNKFISMQLPIFHTLAVCLVGQEQPPVKVHTQQTAGVKRTQSKMHNNATHNAAHKMYIFIVEDTQSTTVESQGTHGQHTAGGEKANICGVLLLVFLLILLLLLLLLLRQLLLVLLLLVLLLLLVVVGSSSTGCCQSAGAANQ